MTLSIPIPELLCESVNHAMCVRACLREPLDRCISVKHAICSLVCKSHSRVESRVAERSSPSRVSSRRSRCQFKSQVKLILYDLDTQSRHDCILLAASEYSLTHRS